MVLELAVLIVGFTVSLKLAKIGYRYFCKRRGIKLSDNAQKKKGSVLNEDYRFVSPGDSHDGHTSNPDGF